MFRSQLLYTFLLLLPAIVGWSQTFRPVRSQVLKGDSNCVITDSLSIVPGSVVVTGDGGALLPDSVIAVDALRGSIRINASGYKEIRVMYQVYPFAFHAPVFRRDTLEIGRAPDSSQNRYAGNVTAISPENEMFRDELVRRGSISRSLTIGNNQNAVMNSTLNLQLSGKLSNDLQITAAITDNNIPLQPDGTTTQIQEFDKVSLRVFNERVSVLAGDFELNRSSGTFLRMNRKVRGGLFTYSLPGTKEGESLFRTQFAGAVSKGKYHRQTLEPIEGNQGPYRLKGANNETFVIIIAGSERIFMDGKLLERGLDKDYTIDYNMAELTFTPRVPVTKDKRIIAEFEYSEQSYARFALFSASDWTTERTSAWLNVFHEQDSKNQPLQQDLTNAEKKTLSVAGDDPLLAAVPGFYEDTLFRNDAVFYKMIDTLAGSLLYDSILVYSINPDSARYRAAFAFAGAGKGNYVQVQSAANGRVFRWVAPVSGIPQGDYEPVRFLVSPRSKTVVSSGATVKLGERTEVGAEGGLSFNDRNTFSEAGDADNAGMSFQVNIRRSLPVKDSSGFGMGYSVYSRFTQQRFDAVDRFRAAEYERDWNLPAGEISDELTGGADFRFRLGRKINLELGSDGLKYGSRFTGLREKASGNVNAGGFRWNFSGSNLNTSEQVRQTSFLRGQTGMYQKLGPVVAGGEAAAEDNRWVLPDGDSLLTGSRRFVQYSPVLMLADTADYPFRAGVVFRTDEIPDSGRFVRQSNARDWFVTGGTRKNPNHTIGITATYREVNLSDTLPVETYITGRAEHLFRTKKQHITLQTFYETGSGMELKKEFAYVEVAPGQGMYQWTDYNQNGIKELNEFEIAAFSDQAMYIRIYTPGTEYMTVFTNRISQNAGFYPDRIWGQKTGMLKFLSRFSNALSYSFENKTGSENWEEKVNPFVSGTNDSLLVSFNRNIRNVFSFNRTHPVFGADYQVQSLGARQTLMNGYDIRNVLVQTLRTRTNIGRFYSLIAEFSLGDRDYISEFFPDKNYNIRLQSLSGNISWQSSSSSRLSVIPRYTAKENRSGTEASEALELSLEFIHSVTEGGNILLKLTRNEIDYNGPPLSPITFEMLEGLAAGTNYLWVAQIVKSLNRSLQMSLNYTGRKTPDSKTVHTGTVEFRAFF